MTVDYSVKRLEPVLGPRDSVTGLKGITWSESTIEMKIVKRGAAGFTTPAGYYGRIEFYGWCCDPVFEFEQIVHESDRYEIKYVHENWDGDNFLWRDCALTLMSIYEATPGSATWKTGPDDPRSKVKDYLDLRVADANLTKDDGATQASWAAIFKSDKYRLAWEFRAASSPVQGLYVVGQPDSTPLLSGSATPRGYEEVVPIDVCAVDSEDCGGEQLMWKMDAELRRVVETYEIGSTCNFTRRAPNTVSLGSDTLYNITWFLKYRRGLT